MPRPTFPISLYLDDRRVVIVTGDGAAPDRVARLREAGADVVELPFDAGDDVVSGALVGATALLAHTGDRARDRQLVAIARSVGAMAYAHDQPAESDFAMPALVRRGPLKLAISTDGTAPSLARRMRELLEAALDSDALDRLITELVALRKTLPRERRGELYDVARHLELTGAFLVRE